MAIDTMNKVEITEKVVASSDDMSTLSDTPTPGDLAETVYIDPEKEKAVLRKFDK